MSQKEKGKKKKELKDVQSMDWFMVSKVLISGFHLHCRQFWIIEGFPHQSSHG
jgi:hypothetical protein